MCDPPPGNSRPGNLTGRIVVAPSRSAGAGRRRGSVGGELPRGRAGMRSDRATGIEGGRVISLPAALRILGMDRGLTIGTLEVLETRRRVDLRSDPGDSEHGDAGTRCGGRPGHPGVGEQGTPGGGPQRGARRRREGGPVPGHRGRLRCHRARPHAAQARRPHPAQDAARRGRRHAGADPERARRGRRPR